MDVDISQPLDPQQGRTNLLTSPEAQMIIWNLFIQIEFENINYKSFVYSN